MTSKPHSLSLLILVIYLFAMFNRSCSLYKSFHRASTGKVYSTSLSAVSTDTLGDQLDLFRKYFPAVKDDAWSKLVDFSNLIVEWNEKVNLVSRKDINEVVHRHMLPSIAISKVKRFKDGETVIDIGCGGGFPGLPLAILNPQANFTLLDGSTKKMAVVQDMVEKLKLENVRVMACRAEECHEQFDSLLGRAVSAIPNFLSFSAHLQYPLSSSGLWYIKGGDFKNELREAKVKTYTLFPVKDSLPIDSDKYVLHIPASEIISFHRRSSMQERDSGKKKEGSK